jgi:hypothetical protein
MCGRDLARYGQAEPQAVIACRKERLADPAKYLGADPSSVIRDSDDHLVAACTNGDFYLAPARCCLDAVHDDIQEHLFNLVEVASERRQPGGRVHSEQEMGPVLYGLGQPGHVIQQKRQVDLTLAGLPRLRKAQKIRKASIQTVRLLSDDSDELLALFFWQTWLLKHPARALDAGYRREELAHQADLHLDQRGHLARSHLFEGSFQGLPCISRENGMRACQSAGLPFGKLAGQQASGDE